MQYLHYVKTLPGYFKGDIGYYEKIIILILNYARFIRCRGKAYPNMLRCYCYVFAMASNERSRVQVCVRACRPTDRPT